MYNQKKENKKAKLIQNQNLKDQKKRKSTI